MQDRRKSDIILRTIVMVWSIGTLITAIFNHESEDVTRNLSNGH